MYLVVDSATGTAELRPSRARRRRDIGSAHAPAWRSCRTYAIAACSCSWSMHLHPPAAGAERTRYGRNRYHGGDDHSSGGGYENDVGCAGTEAANHRPQRAHDLPVIRCGAGELPFGRAFHLTYDGGGRGT